ncbi:MAG: histidine--tRNA ligase, partial [Pseudomonadota bacterium]
MADKKKIYKPKPVSGYMEWLPEYRMIELEWMDKIRSVFESYGFCNIETPSVEPLDVLLAKGETDKEIYTLTRLQADEDESKEARLGLHFDLTVPFARYTAQHFNDLVFPFKRYQIQRSWRGERPQKGRYREFCQCDIDVINIDELPLHFDAEMPEIMYRAYQALDIPPVELRLSNRKILQGYLNGLGVPDIVTTTRILDKLDKIGPDGVISALMDEAGLSQPLAEKSLALAEIRCEGTDFVDQVKALGIEDPLLQQGLDELSFVVKSLAHLPKGAIKVDLSIVRGFDYYTGTILEAYFKDIPFGAIGSGGRYDDLAGSYINKKLPGIGISIGFTRLFALLLDEGYFDKALRKSPADILVVLPSENARETALKTAQQLRDRGYNVET